MNTNEDRVNTCKIKLLDPEKCTTEFLISENFDFIIYLRPTHFNSKFVQDLLS